MRKLLWLFLALPVAAFAQPSNPSVQYVSMAPSGACSASPPVQVVISTGAMYTCNNGTWGTIGGGGSGAPADFTVVLNVASPTFAATSNTSDSFFLNSTFNVSTSNLSGASVGELLTFTVCPNAHTFNWPASFVNFPNISGSGTCTTQSGFYDGTNVNATPFPGGGLPAGCTSSGTGVITCTGAVTGNPLLSGTPSGGATAALPAGSHGFACDETSTTGVPAAGVDYIRCDSVTHQLVYSVNNSAEAPLASAGSAVVLISEQVLSSPAASFNFGSIPATYRDLILKCDGSGSGVGDTGITITHNSDTGANYTMTQMYGVGPTTPGTAGDDGIYLANNFAMGNFPGTGRPAGYPGTLIMTILDYKSTVFYKANFTQTSILLLESSGNSYIVSTNGWWKSTAAITSLQINSGAGNFITGSRCSLYGSY